MRMMVKNIIAESVDGRHLLVKTEEDRGFIEDIKLGTQTEEKSIISLLSANIEWSDEKEAGLISDSKEPEILEKAGWKHEHDGYPEHPIAVKHHQEYFLGGKDLPVHGHIAGFAGYPQKEIKDVLTSIKNEGLKLDYHNESTRGYDRELKREPAIYSWTFLQWAKRNGLTENLKRFEAYHYPAYLWEEAVFIILTPSFQSITKVHDSDITHVPYGSHRKFESLKSKRKAWENAKRDYGEDISHIKTPEYATTQEIPASNMIMGSDILEELKKLPEYDIGTIGRIIQGIVTERQNLGILKSKIAIHVLSDDYIEGLLSYKLNRKLEEELVEKQDTFSEPSLIDYSFLLSYLPGKEILELGCGYGNFLEILQNSGYQATGVEFDTEKAEKCLEGGLNVINHDINKGLFYDDESFDSVVSSHVLEHLDEPDEVIDECCRVARLFTAHIIPLGVRHCGDHKHVWETLDDLKADFPTMICIEIPNSDNTAMIYKGNPKEQSKSYQEVANYAEEETSLKKKEAFSPFVSFTPPKPRMKFFTEFADSDQLYEYWAKKRFDEGEKISIEGKSNTFRGILERKGKRIKLWYEGTNEVNRLEDTDIYQSIINKLLQLNKDFILDIGVGIKENDRPLPRISLMTLLSKHPSIEKNQVVYIEVFDSPYIQEDISMKPYFERKDLIESFIPNVDNLVLVPNKVVNDAQSLKDAVKWAASQEASEGAVAKELNFIYREGGIGEMAKTKTVVEVKAEVIEKKKTKGGQWVYTIGLSDA